MPTVVEVLKEAWDALNEVGITDARVPGEVQAVAFAEAVRLIAGSPVPTQSGSDSLARLKADSASGSASVGEDGLTERVFFERIAKSTGVTAGDLDKCFHLDGDEPRISLPGVKLGKNNADRTRAIAQLLIVGRGYGIPENDTMLDVIRREVVRLKVYDSANFSSQINGLAQAGYVGTGAGKTRKWRAKSPAIEAFPKLIADLLSQAGL